MRTIRCPKCSATIAVEADGEAHVTCATCGAGMTVRPKPPDSPLCPSCREPVEPGAALCINCGYNLETGRRLRTSTDLDEPPVPEEAPAAPMRLLLLVGEWVPGLFRPTVIVLSLLLGAFGLAILGFAWFLFGMGALLTALLVGAVGVIVYAQAIAWMLDGELAVLTEALANLDGSRWLLFFALLFAPFFIFIALLNLAHGA